MRIDQHPDYDATVDAMLASGDLLHDPRESWGDTTSEIWRVEQEHAEEMSRDQLIRWFCLERNYRANLEKQLRVAMRLIAGERRKGQQDATEPVRDNLAAYARLHHMIADARRSGRKTLRVEALIDAIQKGDNQ